MSMPSARLIAAFAVCAALCTPRVTHATVPVLVWRGVSDAPFRGAAAATVDPAGHLYVDSMDSVDVFASYSLRAGRWRTLSPLTRVLPTGLSALAAVAGRVYGFGASISSPDNPNPDNAYVYQVATGRWGAIAYAPTDHGGGAAVATKNGRIYVMAGGDAQSPIGGAMESYDPRTGNWQPRARMHVARFEPAAVIEPDGRVYVLGGVSDDRRGAGTFATSSVEAYDPRADRWTILAPMPTARAGLAAALGREGRIYAIGGTPDSINDPQGRAWPRALSTVEIYDPRTNRWHRGPNLGVARWSLAAAALPDGAIYAIGGIGVGDDSLPTVERLPVPATSPLSSNER